MTLAAIATPYAGAERLADNVSQPYLVYRVWASGSVRAPTWELASRLAARDALRVALFLSLLLRTGIEAAQSVESICQGDASDLEKLYPQVVDSTPGVYSAIDLAFAQAYGPTPGPDSPARIYKIPADAGNLWERAASLDGRDETAFWSSLAAYRTAWQLRYEFPSFGFVSLVTAIEALIDGSALERCKECGAHQGLGRTFREFIVEHTGANEVDLKKFTGVAYTRRSKTVHEGTLHGTEGSSPIGRAGGWAPDPAVQFEYSEWRALETLVACSLLTWLRRRAADG